ncbi:MAG: glutamine-hydrolyzing carbamoyl-phosphate synthase small subunit [Leptospirales bacterium]
MKNKHATLILSDGNLYPGTLIGEENSLPRIGEVVFNTAMSGYQEIITDPSYRGQMICFTYPSIGNYGFTAEDNESYKSWLEGMIVKDYCEVPSNFRSEGTLASFLDSQKIPGITGIDTRALVRHIRESGSMKGGIFPGQITKESANYNNALQELASAPDMEGANLADIFDGKSSGEFCETYLKKHSEENSMVKIAALDFGIKNSIIKNLIDAGLEPEIFPGDQPIENWKNFNPDNYAGFFLSNGPGDPAAVTNGIENIKTITGYKKPIFGICLGHQMLSLALGAKTGKLKFGHHGGNQPVKAVDSNKVIITAQNHGFAVEGDFFESEFFKSAGGVYEINPNDNTIEGYYLEKEKVISIQYHPEAGPGPNDALFIFNKFRDMFG